MAIPRKETLLLPGERAHTRTADDARPTHPRRPHFQFVGHRIVAHLLLLAIHALHGASATAPRADTGALAQPPPGGVNPTLSPPPPWPPCAPGSALPAPRAYAPRAPLAAPPSALLKYLRTHPLTLPLATHHSFCCEPFRLRDASHPSWALAEDVRGKPGLTSAEVNASVYLVVSGEDVRDHLRIGVVQASVLKSYQGVGTFRVRLLSFSEADTGPPACSADLKAGPQCGSRRREPRAGCGRRPRSGACCKCARRCSLASSPPAARERRRRDCPTARGIEAAIRAGKEGAVLGETVVDMQWEKKFSVWTVRAVRMGFSGSDVH